MKVHLELSVEKREDGSHLTHIHRKIEIIGDLTQEIRERMLTIANVCPIHKLLTNTVEIKSSLA